MKIYQCSLSGFNMCCDCYHQRKDWTPLPNEHVEYKTEDGWSDGAQIRRSCSNGTYELFFTRLNACSREPWTKMNLRPVTKNRKDNGIKFHMNDPIEYRTTHGWQPGTIAGRTGDTYSLICEDGSVVQGWFSMNIRPLRYRPGQNIEYKTTSGWEHGKIVCQNNDGSYNINAKNFFLEKWRSENVRLRYQKGDPVQYRSTERWEEGTVLGNNYDGTIDILAENGTVANSWRKNNVRPSKRASRYP